MTSNGKLKRVSAAVAATAAVFALGVGGGTAAFGAIEPHDTSCSNNGGHNPGGQQPSCSGGGLTQNTENQNPAGHAPGGHNK
ncbi:hypothetical protein [Streptomyces sp. NPDC093225]|uniref:hypothetical protein n=1 Tax=Streptomyces sp. NPDC093225 TaxID=3366034 RepID=UPI0037F45DDA